MTILIQNKDRNHLTTESPWSPYWSDYFCATHHCPYYLEVYKNNKNLVICYGDSWTWGDSLGKIDPDRNMFDNIYRKQHVYGALIAQELNADFVNCAIPGVANYWIHDRLQILLDNDIQELSKKYEKIFIVITLTEVGRELDFNLYIEDFTKFYNLNDKDFSFEKLLQKFEEFDFKKIKNIQESLPTNCQVIVGRNFTNTHKSNLNILKNLLPKTWTDVLFEIQNFDVLQDVFMTSFALQRFDKFIKKKKLNTSEYKKWFLEFLQLKANKQIDLLMKSNLNFNKSTHPTETGHKFWAEYIISYINELNNYGGK